jgi:hypothetical protein
MSLYFHDKQIEYRLQITFCESEIIVNFNHPSSIVNHQSFSTTVIISSRQSHSQIRADFNHSIMGCFLVEQGAVVGRLSMVLRQ